MFLPFFPLRASSSPLLFLFSFIARRVTQNGSRYRRLSPPFSSPSCSLFPSFLSCKSKKEKREVKSPPPFFLCVSSPSSFPSVSLQRRESKEGGDVYRQTAHSFFFFFFFSQPLFLFESREKQTRARLPPFFSLLYFLMTSPFFSPSLSRRTVRNMDEDKSVVTFSFFSFPPFPLSTLFFSPFELSARLKSLGNVHSVSLFLLPFPSASLPLY